MGPGNSTEEMLLPAEKISTGPNQHVLLVAAILIGIILIGIAGLLVLLFLSLRGRPANNMPATAAQYNQENATNPWRWVFLRRQLRSQGRDTAPGDDGIELNDRSGRQEEASEPHGVPLETVDSVRGSAPVQPQSFV